MPLQDVDTQQKHTSISLVCSDLLLDPHPWAAPLDNRGTESSKPKSTHTREDALSPSLSLSDTHTYTRTCTHTLSLSHTHTKREKHTDTLRDTHSKPHT